MTKERLQRSAERVRIAAFIVRLTGFVFLGWGAIRFLLVSFPSMAVGVANVLRALFNLKETPGNLVSMYTAVQGMFLLPDLGLASYFQMMFNVIITIFFTLIICVIIFTISAVLNLLADYVLARTNAL